MQRNDCDALDDSGDFSRMMTDGLIKINFKQIGIMFLIFMILTSDVFVNRILSNFSGAVEGKSVTNYGAILQGIMLVTLYVMLDIAVKYQVM